MNVGRQVFSEAELERLVPSAAYSLRSPMPQVLLVLADPDLRAGATIVRTTTLTPLSWGPYTKAVSIPAEDRQIVRALAQEGAECVLGLPSRDMLRQIAICAQRLPRGISEAEVARLHMCRSLYVDVLGIDDCPVNLECVVERIEPYHGHTIALLRVVGGSIRDEFLFAQRSEIVARFPTNEADSIVDESGAVHMRVSLLSELFLCPTFPVAPKKGWYGTFDLWMRDLADEGYLQPAERDQVTGWHACWQEIFAELGSPERAWLRAHLTELIRLIAHEQWDQVHAFLDDAQARERG
jgi:flavin reductase (DIM6/NTAB) family NADH-FMN oxidoreductase RutF